MATRHETSKNTKITGDYRFSHADPKMLLWVKRKDLEYLRINGGDYTIISEPHESAYLEIEVHGPVRYTIYREGDGLVCVSGSSRKILENIPEFINDIKKLKSMMNKEKRMRKKEAAAEGVNG